MQPPALRCTRTIYGPLATVLTSVPVMSASWLLVFAEVPAYLLLVFPQNEEIEGPMWTRVSLPLTLLADLRAMQAGRLLCRGM